MNARQSENLRRLSEIVYEMASMPFFPSEKEPSARLALVKMAAQLGHSESNVKAAVRLLMRNYDEWPGPRAFRRALSDVCRLEPCHQVVPSLPRPAWWLDWAGNQNDPLALPAAPDALQIEASPDTVRALVPSKALMRRRERTPVHVMPKPKNVPPPPSDAEIQQREAIRVEVERLLTERTTERKKGSA